MTKTRDLHSDCSGKSPETKTEKPNVDMFEIET